MTDCNPNGVIEVFSTCPASNTVDPDRYEERVAEVARWSEDAGCRGILVYTDNSLVDPWLVSAIIIENTRTLCPLVAVQPVYLHPCAVAKMLASFGYLYGRRLYLNMVAGGFKNDLTALNDTTPHDKRYERLIEYTTIIKLLLSSRSPVCFEGEFYKISNLKMTPPLPQNLFPGITISGSSATGLAAAKALDAVAIQYPKRVPEYETDPLDRAVRSGIRVGIIARESENTAWEIAYQRFPEDRKGQLTHQLAMKASDSVWHKQLSDLGEQTKKERSPYWLVPFENYKTFCPYLVGSYGQVAKELAGYLALGHKTFILDIPVREEDLQHTNIVFNHALQQVAQVSLGKQA